MSSWHPWKQLLAVVALVACSGARTEDDDVLLSGSIRWDPESEQPVDRAFVRVVDANKSQRCFVTSCDGTFSVRRADVRSLAMPLTSISVERVDRPEGPESDATSIVLRRMSGRIGRERSCNGCHLNGLSLFSRAAEVPAEGRSVTTSCASGAKSAEILCPEDRFPPSSTEGLELVRDFDTYAALVHDVVARRCGSTDCHGGNDPSITLHITNDRRASFESITSDDPSIVMTKARGGAGHGGGTLIFAGDPADQCVADWLGVPRAAGGPSSSERLSHADACRRAAALP